MTAEDFDPNRASIQTLANASLPLLLPIPKAWASIGMGFDTRLATDNQSPWKSSIFDVTRHSAAVVELKEEKHSYRAHFTFSSHHKSDHFSGSLGVTIGNDFLSGGVQGQYDKLVDVSDEVKIHEHYSI